MPDQIRITPFVPEMLPIFGNFDYGSEPYQEELGEWLRADAETAMAKGTKVWVYASESGDPLGFGSLGVSRWRYPDSDSRPGPVAVIPAVALRREFWGKPDGAARAEMYSF